MNKRSLWDGNVSGEGNTACVLLHVSVLT
jgi:hypothetical protein